MSVWIESCRGRDLIRAVVREAADDHKYDPWGSGMSALAVLTDAAFWLGEDVHPAIATPAPSWRPGGEWIEAEEHTTARELIEAIEEGQATREDLAHGIEWVDRYLSLPAVAARSY